MTQLSATDRKSIRAAEKEAAQFEQSRVNFLVSAMGLPQGRAYFHALIESCETFHTAPAFETNRDYTALGARNVGMRIFTEIMLHCPDSFPLMMKEANDRAHLSSARQLAGSPESLGGDPESRLDAARDDAASFYTEPESE